MPSLDLDKLKAHRARTFNLPPHPSLTSPAQALGYVNERGFIYFKVLNPRFKEREMWDYFEGRTDDPSVLRR